MIKLLRSHGFYAAIEQRHVTSIGSHTQPDQLGLVGNEGSPVTAALLPARDSVRSAREPRSRADFIDGPRGLGEATRLRPIPGPASVRTRVVTASSDVRGVHACGAGQLGICGDGWQAIVGSGLVERSEEIFLFGGEGETRWWRRRRRRPGVLLRRRGWRRRWRTARGTAGGGAARVDRRPDGRAGAIILSVGNAIAIAIVGVLELASGAPSPGACLPDQFTC